MTHPKVRKQHFKTVKEIVKRANGKVVCSACIMGLGQFLYRQWAKGILYLLIQIAAICFFVFVGAEAIAGFFTLGTIESNAWYGIEGDNSVIMMLMGILAFIVLAIYLYFYYANIKDAYAMQCAVEQGKKPRTLKDEMRSMLDDKFYKTALFVPIIGVCIFNVLPIVFMILMFFTNYGPDVKPPVLIDWKGFESFIKVLTLGQLLPRFSRSCSGTSYGRSCLRRSTISAGSGSHCFTTRNASAGRRSGGCSPSLPTRCRGLSRCSALSSCSPTAGPSTR